MNINLSAQTINIVAYALKRYKYNLETDLHKTYYITPTRKAQLKERINKVDDALAVFEELTEGV